MMEQPLGFSSLKKSNGLDVGEFNCSTSGDNDDNDEIFLDAIECTWAYDCSTTGDGDDNGEIFLGAAECTYAYEYGGGEA